MRSLLRRLIVPLVGAGLVIVVITVALVVLDLGGSTVDGAGSLPAIQIGSASAAPMVETTSTIGSTTVTAPESPLGEQGQGQGQGSGSSAGQGYKPATTQSQGGTTGPGSTLRDGKTTIVTGSIRVQPGSGPHGGGSSAGTSTTTATTTTTTDAESPTTTGTSGGSATSSTQETPSTGGPHGSTSTSSTAGQSPSTTGGPSGGMHGTPSTIRGR